MTQHTFQIDGRRLRVGWVIVGVAWLGYLVFVGQMVAGHPDGAVDFATYYRASNDMRAGVTIYAADPTVTDTELPYVYPPLLSLLLVPLTTFDLENASRIWFWLNGFCLLGSTLWLARYLPHGRLRRGFVLSPLLFSPVFLGLLYGQVTILLYGLAALTWIALEDDRPVVAGILLALAVWIKVYPLLLIGYFVWKRAWRVVMSALAAGIVLGGIQWLTAGPDTLRYFSEVLPAFNAVGQPQLMALNQSILGFATRLWSATSHSYPAAVDPMLIEVTRLGLTLLLGCATLYFISYPIRLVETPSARSGLEYVLVLMVALVGGSTLGAQGMVSLLLGYVVVLRGAERLRGAEGRRRVYAGCVLSFGMITFHLPLLMGFLSPDSPQPWFLVSIAFEGLIVLWLTAGLTIQCIRRMPVDIVDPSPVPFTKEA